MINHKLENMKEAAYFDYFKSFSLNASDTIKKLEHQFKEEIEESFFLDPSMMFKRIKTLLGSYEILIYCNFYTHLEINDSCEFVEIPQFGNCILKIFLQIMSVIRFLLHKIAQKSSKKQEPSALIDRTNSFQKTHSHMTHTHLSHTPSVHEQHRMMYKKKEQSKYIINTLNQELSLLEMEQSQNSQESKKEFRSLIEGKEKLQSIEISQNENILSQALNSFCKKGEHLRTFVNIRQAAMISNMKEGVGEYMKVKDILDDNSNAKLNNASIRLQELFKAHVISYVKEKQSEMVSQEIQVKIEDQLENKLMEENKHIKKLNELIRKLNDEIGFEQQKSQSLENLLKSKNEEFQMRAMEFRVAKIEMENMKAKNDKILEAELNLLSSKNDLCSNCHTKISASPGYKKSEIDSISKSIIEASDQNEQQIQGNEQRRSDPSIQNPSRLLDKIARKQHHKNTSSLTRKNLAYKKISSKSDEMEIISLTWEIKIAPQVVPLQKIPSKKRILQRAPSMNNTFSSFKDSKKSKTKVVITAKNEFEIERVFAFGYAEGKNWTVDTKPSSKLIGIRTLNKKRTEASFPDNESMARQVTEKWLNNDRVHESFCNDQDGPGNQNSFSRGNLQTELNDSRDNTFDNKLFHSNSEKANKEKLKQLEIVTMGNDKQNNTQMLFKKIASKSYNNGQQRPEAVVTFNEDEPQNSGSRLSSNPNSSKLPRFLKFTAQYRIPFTMKELVNLFFDIETAKNFEYINLFQNDELRVGSTAKEIRKTNQALTANIKQMQKKNFINGLITKVKGEVASRNGNTGSPQRLESGKSPKNNDVAAINCTFSGTLIKTPLWNHKSGEKSSFHEKQQILKNYDQQTLIAMLFKQLRDLKRVAYPPSIQMTNYEMVRNFLRYPYSAVSLQTDKTFLEKQRQESGIEYLELRKIMHRVFKLHKNCRNSECKNIFQKLGLKDFSNGERRSVEANESENVLCMHLVGFFETVGILLLPTKSSEYAEES